jgi:2-amino-4-hydroxy-6-hydroxymethyldihydropteridine diphosphokinase
MTVRAAIGLGANQGDRLGALRRAASALADLGVVAAVSSLYETAPVGGPSQPDYLNAVVVVDTELSPLDLLGRLQAIEEEAGRVRGIRWGPRTLDLDLLCYGERRLDLPVLVVPHPRAAERRFVLAPLAEVWPQVPVGEGLDAATALSRVRGQRVFRWDGAWVSATPTLGRRGLAWVGAQFVLLTAYGVVLALTGGLAAHPAAVVGGALTALAGAVLGVSAAGRLGGSLTALPQPRQDGTLVEHGVYALVRHPIYGAVVLLLVGVGAAFGSFPAGLFGVAMAGFFAAKSRREERNLLLAYPGYEAYRARVRRRFIPWVW